MDSGIICFTTEEIFETAASSKGMAGFAMPSAEFREACTPMAAVTRLTQEEITYLFFTISLAGPGAPDVIGELWMNAALTAGAALLHREFREEAEAAGLQLSDLYAPGQGDVPLEAAVEICSLTGAEFLGVAVEETGLMRPAFTRCGYYLMGEVLPDPEETGCSGCRGNSGGCGMCQRFVYKVE